jgi:hypothetical protein
MVDESPPLEEFLPFIMGVSNRALHLEYFALSGDTLHCWERVGEEWVICDKIEPAAWPVSVLCI